MGQNFPFLSLSYPPPCKMGCAIEIDSNLDVAKRGITGVLKSGQVLSAKNFVQYTIFKIVISREKL